MTLFHPSGRPTGRSRWPGPLVVGLAAVLLAATLLGFGTAGAQQAPDPTETSATSEPTTTEPDATTTTTEPDADAATTTTTTTDPTVDATTTTTPAGGGNGFSNDNVNNLPAHDGTQKGDVFNSVPFGEIPEATPQVLVLRPGSGRLVPLNREITIRARFSNFEPGHFSDPKTQYGISPQRLNSAGHLEGHNHGCIQRIARSGAVPDVKCNSFVVLEQEGTSDILTGVAPPLTEPGRYRVCVDAASETHYVGVRAFAQQGGPVDCVRILALDFSQLRNR